MSAPGYWVYDEPDDLYSIMTYTGDLALGPADTANIFSVFITIQEGTVSSLREQVDQARLWIKEYLSEGCGCCGMYTGGFTGNTNSSEDGKITLSDISRLIDHVFISKTELECMENGNVNGSEDGKITLSDISRLIDHVYISKEPTAACY
jgi:hypothetical protein